MLRNLLRSLDRRALIVLLALPFVYLALILWVRHTAGPFWTWYSIDPIIRYLLDALNLLHLRPPGNVDHPGATVQLIGAFVLKILHPLSSADEITRAVLSDIDAHIWPIFLVLTLITAIMVFAVGVVGWQVSGSLICAIALQLSPFMSRVLLQNAFGVMPAPLLIASALAMSCLVLLMVGSDDEAKNKFAVAFGVVGGFVVASKVTGVPVLVLPIFLLWGRKSLAIYLGVIVSSAMLFAFPTLFEAGKFFDWIAKVAIGSGAYGGGAPEIVNLETYPRNIYKFFSRPILLVPVVLSLGIVIWGEVRRRSGRPVPKRALQGLAGIALAITFHILVVAKHPSAHYLVSSMTFSGLALTLTYMAVRRFEVQSMSARRWAFGFLVFLVAGLALSRGNSAAKLLSELAEKQSAGAELKTEPFAACLKVFGVFTSHPTFALTYGNEISGRRFSNELSDILPKNEVIYLSYRGDFLRPEGPVEIADLVKEYPCVYARSTVEHGGAEALKYKLEAALPADRQFSTQCPNKYETVFTAGVDCQGRPLD